MVETAATARAFHSRRSGITIGTTGCVLARHALCAFVLDALRNSLAEGIACGSKPEVLT